MNATYIFVLILIIKDIHYILFLIFSLFVFPSRLLPTPHTLPYNFYNNNFVADISYPARIYMLVLNTKKETFSFKKISFLLFIAMLCFCFYCDRSCCCFALFMWLVLQGYECNWSCNEQ